MATPSEDVGEALLLRPLFISHAHLGLLAQVQIALTQQQHEDAGDGGEVEARSPAEPPGRSDTESAGQEIETKQASKAAQQPQGCLEGQGRAEHGANPAEEDEDCGRTEAAEVVEAHVLTALWHPDLCQLHSPVHGSGRRQERTGVVQGPIQA